MASPEECIDALHAAADRLGKSPTKAEYEDLGLQPASATIMRNLDGWNTAKEYAGMNTNPSRGPRVASKPDHVSLPPGQSWESLTVDQRWAYRHPKKKQEKTLARRARLRAWINEIKRKRGCSRCGEEDYACLDFHHLDQDEKERSVGKMVTFGAGRKRLRAEMAKCEVICANCHSKLHTQDPRVRGSTSSSGTTLARRWVFDQKEGSDGCRCGESDPRSLEFHHVGEEKTDHVATLVTDGRSIERIGEEMQACVVICSNCHRRTHFVEPTPP